jgi:hypothetical protein
VDRAGCNGRFARAGTRSLGPLCRVGTAGCGGGLLHHQGIEGGGEKAGRNPVDRGKRGTKRSTAVDAKGIPLGTVTAPANRHESPLLTETLDAVAQTLGELPQSTSIHLDRGYDSESTRQRLRERTLNAEISPKGEPLPR